MKSAIVLALVASLGLAQAQGGMSDCSRKCLSNMMDLAEDLGCSATDMSCICSKIDFEYGIRDCTKEACPEDDPSAAIAAGLAQCPNQSATGSMSGSASATETGNESTGSANPTETGDESGSSTGSANPTETGDESGSSTGSGNPTETGSPTSESVETVTTSSPLSTDEVISTITDGSETFESTIGRTTMYTEVTNTRTGSDPSETGDGSGSDGDDASGTESGTAAPTDDGDSAASRAMAGTGLMGALGLLALIAA